MGKLNHIIDQVLFYYLAASLAALVGICFVQVVVRYLFSASFAWAEEVSIILMVWSTWAGVCLGVNKGAHLRILFIVDRLGVSAQRVIRLLTHAMAIVFLVYIVWTSRIILDGMTNLTLLSLPFVPMKVLYFSVPIGCSLVIYYLLRQIGADLTVRAAKSA